LRASAPAARHWGERIGIVDLAPIADIRIAAVLVLLDGWQNVRGSFHRPAGGD
jgi:hypothetical protein